MKTLLLTNQKGGVGKTAVCTLLAHYLAWRGQRVLAIDLDHQGNFGQALRLSGRVSVAVVGSDQVFADAEVPLPAEDFVLLPAGAGLLALERQPQLHTPFARQWRAFFERLDGQFDVCLIDTNPNPDIRVLAPMASADCVLSPVQLNQEALSGVVGLLSHERVGVRRVAERLNPKLRFLGILPTMVEPTPFQKANLARVLTRHGDLLIPLSPGPGFAQLPRRSAVAEAQAVGSLLWEMKKTAARDAWRDIEPTLRTLVRLLGVGVVGDAAAGVHSVGEVGDAEAA